MHDNIGRYMCADNAYVRREYNAIRLNLAILLRTLFSMDEELSPPQKYERLQRFRLAMEEQDIIANGMLDKLIREQKIPSDMATSLMNDSSYAYELQSNLIDAAEIVFANLFSVERDMSLSEEEVEQEMIARRDEIQARLRQEQGRIDSIAESGQ